MSQEQRKKKHKKYLKDASKEFVIEEIYKWLACSLAASQMQYAAVYKYFKKTSSEPSSHSLNGCTYFISRFSKSRFLLLNSCITSDVSWLESLIETSVAGFLVTGQRNAADESQFLCTSKSSTIDCYFVKILLH